MNCRRLLFAAVVLGSLVAPLSDAQSASRLYRIGYFVARAPDAALDAAFIQGLSELGYEEGRNILIERRFADNKAEALPVLAAELATMNLDVIVVAPTHAAAAMKKATRTIPIVMANAGDPIGAGLIVSLARPGGNVTGLSNVSTDIIGKEKKLLKEKIPGLTRIAFLASADSPIKDAQLREAQAAAKSLRVELVFEQTHGAADLERAFTAMARARPSALVVALDPLMFGERQRLANFAAKHRLPSISAFREFAEAGGLIAYGSNLPDMFRRSATYVDKILRGAKPADMPVEQPLKFDMVVNLKTAKALGITIPPEMLLRADEVIR